MLLLQSSQNLTQYLQKNGLCGAFTTVVNSFNMPASSQNNQNFRVILADERHLLVKQKTQPDFASNPQDFFNEWLFEQLLQKSPLGNISVIAPLLLHYDAENSLLIRNYLSEYVDLEKFYCSSSIFPQGIAIAIGRGLAELHSATFQSQEYRDFITTAPPGEFRYHFYNPAQGINSISPEIFGQVPTGALQFHALYQNRENIESAIADLAYEWLPCCLTHNDLRLSNILLHYRWEQLDNYLVRFIDWETCTWGDPAYDLGTLIASYLKIWLASLVVDHTIELEESWHLAMIPLEHLQPSILALIQTYLSTFTQIIEYHPDLIIRVIQFAGLALIHQIQEIIAHDKYFDNSNLCMLQIAEKLLTTPEEAALTIFGVSTAKILESITHLPKIPQSERGKQLSPIYYEKTRLRGC